VGQTEVDYQMILGLSICSNVW